MLQTEADEDQQPDHQQAEIVVGLGIDAEGIAEEPRRGRAVEADRAVRQVGRVARDDRHDLAEAERDDGEIVAAQPQGGGGDHPPALLRRKAAPLRADRAAGPGPLAQGFGHRRCYDLRGTSRPSRPLGRNTRTRIRIEKMMTSVQRVAISCPPRDSISPIRMPPSMAPGMLPMPPSTAAVKALKPAV